MSGCSERLARWLVGGAPSRLKGRSGTSAGCDAYTRAATDLHTAARKLAAAQLVDVTPLLPTVAELARRLENGGAVARGVNEER